MSKFDAVIYILKVELSWAETRGWCPDKNKINQLCSAIRVLEAAGKVDRERALSAIERSERGGAWSDGEAYGQVCDLLEALPEES